MCVMLLRSKKLQFSLCTRRRQIEGVEVLLYSLLSSALKGGKWSASRAHRFNSKERATFTHCVRGWVVPTAGLQIFEKGFEPRIVQPLS